MVNEYNDFDVTIKIVKIELIKFSETSHFEETFLCP